eukprot:scaffold112667_cov73-Phaeocystis_antarctica.AAC.2
MDDAPIRLPDRRSSLLLSISRGALAAAGDRAEAGVLQQQEQRWSEKTPLRRDLRAAEQRRSVQFLETIV